MVGSAGIFVGRDGVGERWTEIAELAVAAASPFGPTPRLASRQGAAVLFRVTSHKGEGL